MFVSPSYQHNFTVRLVSYPLTASASQSIEAAISSTLDLQDSGLTALCKLSKSETMNIANTCDNYAGMHASHDFREYMYIKLTYVTAKSVSQTLSGDKVIQ